MKHLFNKKKLKQLIAVITLIQIPFYGKSINYTFSASSGTFTPLSSPTNIWSSGDDVTANNIPIGFNFNFGGVASSTVVTEVSVNSNGWIALGSNYLPNYTSYSTNNLATTTIGPIIAPLWDDISIASGSFNYKVNYQTSGTPGNQVFTVEWLGMSWQFGYSTPTISFQVKLYEATGVIEFIYQQESGIVHTGSASIGIANMSSTDFYSLNNTTSTPNANYGIETNTINTKPASGQVYRWTPAITTSVSNYSFEKKEINVFPNPFKNEITISEKLKAGDKIIITNSLGEMVYESELVNQNFEYKINLKEEMSAGIYFLNIVSEEKKIVKQLVKI